MLWLGKVTIVDPLVRPLRPGGGAEHDLLPAAGRDPVRLPAVLVSALGSGITLRRFLKV